MFLLELRYTAGAAPSAALGAGDLSLSVTDWGHATQPQTTAHSAGSLQLQRQPAWQVNTYLAFNLLEIHDTALLVLRQGTHACKAFSLI